jgi:hypothetical protein
VGAQKTGTTWLHTQLKDHPQIGFSHVKEVHYFNTIHNGSILLTTRKVEHIKKLIENNRYALEKYFSDLSGKREVDQGITNLLAPVDDEWYTNLLKTNKKYSADFTPEYALLPQEGFQHFKKISRNQKIIFIMRDPIERAKSAIQYYYKTHNRDINAETDEQIKEVAEKDFILKMSKYEYTIQALKNEFTSDNLLFLFYENMMNDKQKAITSVTDFLDVEDILIDKESLDKRVNVSEKYIFPESINTFLESNLQGTYEYLKESYNECKY